MSLSEKDILHVAKLSAIALDPVEVESFRKDLGEILEYVNQLSILATHGVPPTLQVHGASNAFRDDITKDSLPQSEVGRNAPDFAAGCFRVPKVI